MIPRIKAVVLAGGKSRRMGEDKSQLRYNGVPQLERCLRLLSEAKLETFVSLRYNQETPAGIETQFQALRDEVDYIGPAGGIISAYHCDPTCAWLVLACDLPLLNSNAIWQLINNRNPDKDATVFVNPETKVPEPLVSVWEPSGLRLLGNNIAKGEFSPLRTLQQLNICCQVPHDPRWIFNANTPEERQLANFFSIHSRQPDSNLSN